MFWALGGGYTTNIRRAEVFSVDEARRQHESRNSDIPMRLDYLEARREKMVDCQNLKPEERPDTVEKLLTYPAETLFYAVVPRQWDGNAVYFVAREGSPSTDVDKARLYTREDAKVLLEAQVHHLWPQTLIDSFAYWRIPEPWVNRRQALKDTGIQLVKPRRQRQFYKCGSCGKFCSAEAYYTQTCSCNTSPHY